MKILLSKLNMLLIALLVIGSPAASAAVVDACATEGPTTGSSLTNGDAICVPAGTNSNSISYYYILVPANTSTLYIRAAHGTGNGNVYYRASTWATASSYDQSSTNSGNTESINVNSPAQGYRFVSVTGQHSGMTLLVSTTNPDGGSSSGGSSSGGSSSGGSSSGGSSSGGSSSGGSSSGGSSSGGLSNGQTVTGLSASQGNRTATYYIDVPSGASNLSISISGGTGDADLYVKKGSVPTDSSYDCRPYDSGNNETCGAGGDALATSQGRFYINAKAYSTFSGVSLTASYQGGGSSSGGSSSGGSSSGGSSSGGSSSGGSSSGGSSSGGSSSGGLSNGQTVTGLSASQGNYTSAYYIDVPSGASNLSIAISGGTGDADLYVKKGSEPTDSSYDCRPYDSGNNETCGVGGDTLATSAGRFYIKLKAYSTFSGVSLTASYTGGGSSSGGSSSGGSSSGGSSGGNMPDVCATSDPTTDTALEDGVPVCVKATNQFTSFSIAAGNEPNRATSIAITTSHGLGNLTLEGRASGGTWPETGDDSVRSSHVGNTECIVITNIDRYWANVTLRGLFKGVTVVADLNATTCRATPGAVDIGNTGYTHNGVHVIIHPIRFPSVDLEFTNAQITTEMNKVKTYFTEQSYGNFDVTWEIKPKITMDQSKSTFDNDKTKWNPAYKAKILETGTDPDFPGEGQIVMMTAPPIGTEATNYINSQAGPPLMEIYTYAAGTIAHEMGHALGLHHSMSIEGGNSTLNGNTNDVVTNYGNVFALMGMGAHTLEDINIMYKSYFKGNPWFTENDVPLVTSSGTYRIYTHGHGTASGHNAPGDIGIRLQSGDGDKIYFIEYFTEQNTEVGQTNPLRTPLLQNGILVHLQGYMDTNVQPWWNHTSLMLDFTPNSRSSSWALEDFNDSPLQIGQSWTDRWNGFRITPTAKGGTLGTANAWIEVQVEIF